MLKRTWISIFVGLLLFLSMAGPGFAARVYDDFNATGIDRNKWQEGTFYRNIDVINSRLLLKIANPAPIMMTTFPYNYQNGLVFSDPDSVTSMQADATVLDSSITGTARAHTRIGGRFYNDGTGAGSGDFTGDIWAEVALRRRGTGLEAYYNILRYTTPDGDSTTQLAFSYFTVTITQGTTYTLSIEYNSSANQFIFKVGAETLTVSSPTIPTYNRSPSMPWKGLQVYVRMVNATETASMIGSFDNVYKNGALYDSFNLSTIDTSKWGNHYEFKREVTNGRLYSLAKASAHDAGIPLSFPLGFAPGLSLNWDNPIAQSIKFAAATVTPLSYERANNAIVGARIAAVLYNDGSSSGSSWVGDINPVIGLFVVGSELRGRWAVNRHTEDPSNPCAFETLAEGLFTATINLGTPYHLFLGFDGTTITFRLNSEVATYTPTTSINPAHNDYGNVGGRVILCDNTQNGRIEAEFDDILISDSSSVDFDMDGKTDISVYRTGTGAWYVLPSSGATPYGIGWGGDATDKPAPGDFDGDGKADIAVYRTGTGAWYVLPSSGATPYGIGWGGDASDKPTPGDYDGDGKADIAVYRTGTGAWYVLPSSGATPYGIGWGGDATDKPAPGDFDGDGKADVAVYRASTGAWYVIPSSGATPYGIGWGGDATDKPAAGDFDGDGKTDIAVYRTGTGAWYILPSSGATPYGIGWGGDATDKPAAGDFDGDGKTDIAVYRASTGAWYIYPSGGTPPYGLGWGGDVSDIPVRTNPGSYM